MLARKHIVAHRQALLFAKHMKVLIITSACNLICAVDDEHLCLEVVILGKALSESVLEECSQILQMQSAIQRKS